MTKACACCHAVCEIDLPTCPLCGEASWVEVKKEDAEATKKLASTVIDETYELPKPKKRRSKRRG